MEYPGHIITLGATGDAVKAVQARLGVWQTGQFGPTTAECVSAFQRAHGIGVTASVGPETWAALFRPQPPLSLGAVALAEALTHVGVCERPMGSNRGPEVDAWNSRAGASVGSFWCLSFAYCMVDDAARKAKVPNPLPGTASCSALFNWARQNGRLVAAPQPGDIGLCIGGETGHYHAVMVASVPNATGEFQTVEGNSNTTGSPNGFEVVHRVPGRRLSSCHYVRT